MSALTGCAVPLFSVGDDGRLQLDEASLRRVLLADRVRDQPVVPVAVTGAFRRGKSFLLNVLLRYLSAPAADGDWLAAGGEPLAGFPWRGGRQAHTRGVQLWSRPLPVTLADGRPAHVLLIDTQGAFDAVSTPAESVAVRAVAGLLSAVQIVNVSRQPQADDLEQAVLCAEYGQLWAEAAGRRAPLQRLVVLVRDWAFPADAAYGAAGGQRVLADWLQGGGDSGGEASALRAAADHLQCYLLPHPGAAAAGGGQFSGAPAQLSAEFAAELLRLAPWLLGGGAAAARCVDGRPLTGAGLAELCRALAAADVPPPPENAADALTAAAARRERAAALEVYTARLRVATDGGQPLSDAELQTVHRAAEREARDSLAASSSAGDQEALRQLSADICQHYQRVHTLNSQQRGLRESRADSANAALAAQCRERYEAEMRRALPGDGSAVQNSALEKLHAAAVDSALRDYDHGRDDAGPAAGHQREELQQQLHQRLTTYSARNEARRQRDEAAAAVAAQRCRDQAEAEAEAKATEAAAAAAAVTAVRRERDELAAAVAVRQAPEETFGLAAATRLLLEPAAGLVPRVAEVTARSGEAVVEVAEDLSRATLRGVEAVGEAAQAAAPVVEEAAQALGRAVSRMFRW